MGAFKLIALSDWAKRHTHAGSSDLVLPSGRTAAEPILLGRNVPAEGGHVRYPAAWAHISSKHAKLFADKADEGTERWSVMDTSTNGTFVNDVRIPQGTSVVLKPGDKLRLSVPSKGATGGIIEYEFVYDEHYQEPQSLPYTGNKRKTASTGQQQSSPGVKRNRSISPSFAPETSLPELQRLAAKNEELRGQAAAYRQQIDTLERQLGESEHAKDELKARMELSASKAAQAQAEAAAAAAAQLDAANTATAAAEARAAEADARAAEAEQASAAAVAEAEAAAQATASLQGQLQGAESARAVLALRIEAAEQETAAAKATADAAAAAAAESGAELVRVRAALAAAQALVESERDGAARAARESARALASAERRAASAAEQLDTERERRLVQGRAARASAAAAKEVMGEQLRQWQALVAGGQECFRQLGVALEGVGQEQEGTEEGGGVNVEGDGGVQTSDVHMDYQQTQAFSHQTLQHSDAGAAGNQTPRSHGRRSDVGMEATLLIAQAPVPLDFANAVDGSGEQEQQEGEEQQEEQGQQQQEGGEREEEMGPAGQQEEFVAEEQDGMEGLQELQEDGSKAVTDPEAGTAPADATEQGVSEQLQQGQQENEATPAEGMAPADERAQDGSQDSGINGAKGNDGDADGMDRQQDGQQQQQEQDGDGVREEQQEEEEEQQQEEEEEEEMEEQQEQQDGAKGSRKRTLGAALADNTNRPGGSNGVNCYVGSGSQEQPDFIPLGSGKANGFALEAGQRGETLGLLSGLPEEDMEGDENAMQE